MKIAHARNVRPWIPPADTVISNPSHKPPSPAPPSVNPSTTESPPTQRSMPPSTQQPPATTHLAPEDTPLPQDPQPNLPTSSADNPSPPMIPPPTPPAPSPQETPNEDHTWTIVTHACKRTPRQANLPAPSDLLVSTQPSIPKSQTPKPQTPKPQSIKEPCVRKRTTPTIAGSFGKAGKSSKTPSQTPLNEVSSKSRDRSPLGFRVTNSGNLSYTEAVTRKCDKVPNPPYYLSPDDDSSDINSSSEMES